MNEEGIEELEEEITKKLLLITTYDEWYGPIYTCPFCAEETVMDDFNFCTNCGSDMDGFKFESMSDEQKRMKKENE